MNKEKYIDWPYFIGLMLVPIVVVGLLFLYAKINELTRYDPAYFTEEFLERYHSPGMVAIALEPILREGDVDSIRELLGTRRGLNKLEARPDLILVFLLEADEKYFHYLFFDSSDYNRVLQYIRKWNGRYVLSRMDLYYYMDSGQWKVFAGPLAAAWWSLVIVVTVGVVAYRRTKIARIKMYG
ncbi:MAG: hypothetical protein AMJ88_12400 [Anaerolineae bacterium SM23_ 63]|nr:MAG: hypothetical protein AMJ88_12400 [Anaerolineae bacterium SM23_ 63]HEY45544.1 hypothetical protein [Anaerolineae bacterium]